MTIFHPPNPTLNTNFNPDLVVRKGANGGVFCVTNLPHIQPFIPTLNTNVNPFW